MNIPETYNQLDQWTTVMFLYNSALKAINTKIEILNNEFIHLYNYNPIEHIKSRLKTPESIVKKLKRGGYEVTIPNMIEHLSDIAGIRIICSFSPDIYRIAEMIARQSDVTVLVVKDYIKNPKPNGYKSYHMVVTIPIYLSDGPVDTKVEIQIRTIAMDFWASLEHKIYYKFEGNAPDYLEQELKAAFAACGYEEKFAKVVLSNRPDLCEYQCNGAMLDNKMFSLNQAITKIAEEQAKEKEAAKVAEKMKKAEREDMPAGTEQEPKDGKRSGEAASGNRKEAGE